MKIQWIIVGAGLTGAVFAERIANQLNQKVLVIDQRNHIAGNIYDYYDQNGVLIHKYGPHIFHTSSKIVWEYLSQFTNWHYYSHYVLAVIEGRKVPIPFNLNTLYTLFPPHYAQLVENKLIENYGFQRKVSIKELQEEKDKDINFLAQYIYKQLFYGYNIKQWNLKPEELDPSVLNRLPIFISKDNRYFNDPYQGLPEEGYTKLVQNMLNHPNIKILLQCDLNEIKNEISYDNMVYTGPIDAYFDYKYGKLPYRSLAFHLQNCPETPYWQEAAQINYPNDYEFTRITEYKHMTGQDCPGTTIAFEYPYSCESNKDIPFYPIPTNENISLYQKYKKEADKLKKVMFAGRLADYKYYNMDQAIENALSKFRMEFP